MAVDIKVPEVGESITEGMIESWVKKSGDTVAQDDILFELETDKATIEVPAETNGTLEITVKEGSVVKVGQSIGVIHEQQTAINRNKPQQTATNDNKEQKLPTNDSKNTTSSIMNNGPAVIRLATEDNIDLTKIKGTGRNSRITKEDLIKQHYSPKEHSPKEHSPKEHSPKEHSPKEHSPKEHSLETTSATSSNDLKPTYRKPMSMMRRKIAQRLVEVQQTAAILTTFNEIDMSAIIASRNKYKELFIKKHGIKLGFVSFFVKAATFALKQFKEVNAYIDGNDIIYHDYCDIGVAVSTDKGLVVPIIRNAEHMSLAEIEKNVALYAQKARDKKIAISDLQGGTFTISNGGVFGSLLSTPILNPPQSAILGLHQTQKRPVVLNDGSIVAKDMMYIALSYDHRIIDGKEAVGFLRCIKDNLEDLSRMFIDV